MSAVRTSLCGAQGTSKRARGARSDPATTRLVDAGKQAAAREAARQVRLAAWQRPAAQRARDQLRAGRVADGRTAKAAEGDRRKQKLAAAEEGRLG